MAFLNDLAKDAMLTWIRDNVKRIDLCTQDPTTFAEATSTYSIGYFEDPTIGAVADGDPDGRAISFEAFSGATLTVEGDPVVPTHWAATNDDTSTLVASGRLTQEQFYYEGNTWGLPAWDYRCPDPVEEE